MNTQFNFILAAGAIALAGACLIAILAQRRRSKQLQEAAEAAIYHISSACENRSEALKAELRSAIESLEAGLRGPERALVEGRMSRTARAEALRLLRSGMAPETAAATLGAPKNDLVLLAKVAGVLSA